MDGRLTAPDHVVLGLIARHGPVSAYELKSRVAASIAIFWPIPHAQLYRSTERLRAPGLAIEEVQDTGRRRRLLTATAERRHTLGVWLADGYDSETQIRDPALLKLGFAELGPEGSLEDLARGQAAVHRRWLQTYQDRFSALDNHDPATPARRRLLEAGRGIERAYARYWDRVAQGHD